MVSRRVGGLPWSIELLPKPDVRTSVLSSDTKVFLQESKALVVCRWDVVPGPLSAVGVELPEAASIAKAYCSDAYFFNAGSGIQLHGGVGFTWEYDIQLFFKRAKSSEMFLGNAAYHRERIAKALLDEPGAGGAAEAVG